MSKVYLKKGNRRRENVFESLVGIGDEIKEKIGERTVLIKPNFVSSRIQKAATHVDQLRGILDFLSSFYKKKIIIAEGSAGNTMEGFENFGYFPLKEEYNFEIEFLDLNQDKSEQVIISKGESVGVSKTILDPSLFIISAAKLKTHDTVVVTLSLKNLLVGMIVGEDKSKIHQGVKEINKNLFILAQKRMPDLASLDGFLAMEGEGPIRGKMVELGVALASQDALASDRVGVEIMGIDSSNIGYLNYCAENNLGEYDLNKIEIMGDDIEECKSKRKFKLHSGIERQLEWKE